MLWIGADAPPGVVSGARGEAAARLGASFDAVVLDLHGGVDSDLGHCSKNRTVANGFVEGAPMSELLNARAGETRLKLTTGNWVSGDQFVGREADIARLRRLTDHGDNVLISAMRRVGKTSLMREIIRRIGPDRRCIFVDVEHCDTLTDAIALLAAETRTHQKTFDRVVESFRDFVGAPKKLQIAELSVEFRDRIGAAWREKGDRILAAIAEGAPPPAVICVDELPILLSRILRDANDEPTAAGTAIVEQFMQWLRAARERHRGQLSFVFAGSIGLAPLLRSAGLSATINNLTDLELEPWTPDDERDEATREVLNTLVHDGYVRLTPGSWSPPS